MDHSLRSSLPGRLLPLLFGTVAAGGLTGCNKYLLFNQAGYEQSSFSNEADILFVIDNSASMAAETSALALNFNTFIDTLTSAAGATPVTETLTDAVGNYITYTQQRGRFLDYNLGITTTSVDTNGGSSTGVDPGEAGLLVGGVVAKGDADVAAAFREQLLCDTAFWADTNVPADPGYDDAACSAGRTPDIISQEYLDCVCGFDSWNQNPQGSGNEEPLEAALLALCRSVDDPPEACYDPLAPFAGSTNLVNEGFFRPDGTVVVVVVTDEGDNSRRMAQGEVDPTEAYIEPLEAFGKPVKVVAITPDLDPTSGGVICGSELNPTPPTWSLQRIIDATELTGGFHRNIIVDSADGCAPSDFSKHLADLGNLLVNLVTSFQLQSIPDITTIRVWVDGDEVSQSELRDPSEITDETPDLYSSGWSYDPSQNSITFWGDAIPGFNSDVEIFYRPLASKPRDLPF